MKAPTLSPSASWRRLPAIALLLLATAAIHAVDDRSLTTPTGWWWYHGQSPAGIVDLINDKGARIIDLEVEDASPLTFSAAFVKNSGEYASGWWWYYGLTSAQVSDKINEHDARIVDLEAYDVGGQTRFAIVLVPNTGADAKAWWWYFGVDTAFIGDRVDEHGARIIDLDRYTIDGTAYYSAVMIRNAGADASGWWWYYGLTAQGVADQINLHNARIYDIEVYGADLDRFAVVLVPNTGADSIYWWWYYGVSESYFNDLTAQNGARIADIETYFVNGQKRFAALMVNNANDVTTRLATILGYGSDGWTGVYLKQVDGSVLASLNRSRVFEPASTIKAMAHLHAMLQVQNGSADLDELIEWCATSSNVSSPKDGCPNAPCNQFVTLEFALKQMMWVSDNRATDAVIRRFGRAAINATAASIGMVDSSINHTIGCGGEAVANPDELTLTDIGILYEEAATGILNPSNRQTFYDLMAGKDTTDFSGVWGDMKTIINEEGADLGLSAPEITEFRDAISLSYKAGGYGLNGLTYTSLAGWVELPFCSRGTKVLRDYVFGFFIHGAASSSGASARFGAVRAEILREQIRAALATFVEPCEPAEVQFIRGDSNLDLKLDMSDAVQILGFLFLGGRAPSCEDAADVNDSGKIDISDPTSLLNFLFQGGNLPPRTVPGEYESDPTEDDLGCESYPRPPLR